jgi:hypothetical protein
MARDHLIPRPSDLDIPERREGYVVLGFIVLVIVSAVLLFLPIRDPLTSSLGIMCGTVILGSAIGLLALLLVGRGATREYRDYRREVRAEKRQGGRPPSAFVLVLVAALLVAAFAVPIPARAAFSPAPVEPNPWIAGNVTVRSHLAAYGLYDYSDDAGHRASLPIVADARIRTPFNLSWSKVYAPSILQEEAVGGTVWTNSVKWSASTPSGAPTCSLTPSTVDGVGSSLRFKGSGTGTCQWDMTLVNPVSIDIAKTLFTVGADVLTLPAGQIVTVAAWTDAATSSNYFFLPSHALGCANLQDWYLANVAGVSVFDQELLRRPCPGGAPVTGSVTTIRISVAVSAGTAEIRLFALALNVGAYSLGSDAAGNAVTNQTQAATVGVALATWSPNFPFNRSGSVRIAYRQLASVLPDGRWSAAYDAASHRGAYRFDLGVPSAVDLTYDVPVAQDQLHVPGGEIVSAHWGSDDVGSVYAGRPAGSTVQVRANVPTGTTTPLTLTVAYSDAEWSFISAGGGGGFFGGGGGSWNSIILGGGILLAIIAATWALARSRKKRRARGREETGEGRFGRGGRAAVVLLMAAGLLGFVVLGPATATAKAWDLSNLPDPRGMTLDCTADPIQCGITDVLNAIFTGIANVVKAFFGIFVTVFTAIGVGFATVVTAIISVPWQFFTASWNVATSQLASFGFPAPIAAALVLLGVFALLIPLVLILKGIVNAALPGDQ